PAFPSRIQRDGHGRSGAEPGEQEVIWSGTRVRPADAHRLVGIEAVAADGNPLGESLRAPAHLHDIGLGRLVHSYSELGGLSYCCTIRDTGWISLQCLWFFSFTSVPVIATWAPTGGMTVWSTNPWQLGFASVCDTV